MLEWLSRAPRTYAEVMDAWRTSCPRLSIWEDALAEGWVEVIASDGRSMVRLTGTGHALLAEKSK